MAEVVAEVTTKVIRLTVGEAPDWARYCEEHDWHVSQIHEDPENEGKVLMTMSQANNLGNNPAQWIHPNTGDDAGVVDYD